MDIDEVIARGGKEVNLGGVSIPLQVLQKLKEEGYSHLKAYGYNKTVTLWGKNCSACFTEEQLRKMG